MQDLNVQKGLVINAAATKGFRFIVIQQPFNTLYSKMESSF